MKPDSPQTVRTHYTPAILLAAVLCLGASGQGCASPQHPPAVNIDSLEVGLKLQEAGNHLHAGYWFEAALIQHPEQEQRILRLMVAAQIRSGRLLAAQSGLERLQQISRNDPSIQELALAIKHKKISSNPIKEVAP